MLYENLEPVTLEPVKYDLANIKAKQTSKELKASKKAKNTLGDVMVKKNSFIDSLFNICMVCFFVLVFFTAVNIAGFNDVMASLKDIIENRTIDGFLVNAHFV